MKTQAGKAPNSFRWRGRKVNHTLSSGLDDYPRDGKVYFQNLYFLFLIFNNYYLINLND